MKILLCLTLCFVVLFSSSVFGSVFAKKKVGKEYVFRSGDIVFQATGGRQCRAIRVATHSRYSHCGVVFLKAGKFYVLEAISPVRVTPLETFRQRSLPGTFLAKRLKNAQDFVTQATFDKADLWAQGQLGKPYDLKFLWGNEEMYCSELVWKMFKAAGNIELSAPRRYDSFDLSSSLVKVMIKERFGAMENFPAKELVVAPSDLVRSPLLAEVPSR